MTTSLIDGRTLRKTGRTAQLATKIKPEVKAKLYELAKTCDIPINQIIEESIESIYQEKMKQQDNAQPA